MKAVGEDRGEGKFDQGGPGIMEVSLGCSHIFPATLKCDIVKVTSNGIEMCCSTPANAVKKNGEGSKPKWWSKQMKHDLRLLGEGRQIGPTVESNGFARAKMRANPACRSTRDC